MPSPTRKNLRAIQRRRRAPQVPTWVPNSPSLTVIKPPLQDVDMHRWVMQSVVMSRTENPRGGGSIPTLATLNQDLASLAARALSNVGPHHLRAPGGAVRLLFEVRAFQLACRPNRGDGGRRPLAVCG